MFDWKDLEEDLKKSIEYLAAHWNLPIGAAVERLLAYGLTKAIGDDTKGEKLADWIVEHIEKAIEPKG